jgi:pyruvate dehydrogenase E2 component (dihydrolipoamide acetyltransferase)
MTLHAISIPKWGLSMEEGTLASWLVAEGTEITAGIEIAEIETTKITNVLESQVAGVLRRQIVAAGEVRRVGALIGVVSDADEDEAAIETFIGEWEARFGAEAESLPSSPEPQSLTLGTRQLRFLRAPSQSAKAAIPVILLHGFGGDHLNWLFNQSVLAEQRDVYALDLPGHGRSSKDVGDGSMDA